MFQNGKHYNLITVNAKQADVCHQLSQDCLTTCIRGSLWRLLILPCRLLIHHLLSCSRSVEGSMFEVNTGVPGVQFLSPRVLCLLFIPGSPCGGRGLCVWSCIKLGDLRGLRWHVFSEHFFFFMSLSCLQYLVRGFDMTHKTVSSVQNVWVVVKKVDCGEIKVHRSRRSSFLFSIKSNGNVFQAWFTWLMMTCVCVWIYVADER